MAEARPRHPLDPSEIAAARVRHPSNVTAIRRLSFHLRFRTASLAAFSRLGMPMKAPAASSVSSAN